MNTCHILRIEDGRDVGEPFRLKQSTSVVFPSDRSSSSAVSRIRIASFLSSQQATWPHYPLFKPRNTPHHHR